MRRSLVTISVGLATILALAAMASAHPPEAAPSYPEDSLRTLYLIAHQDKQAEPEPRPSYVVDAGLALSQDLNSSEAPSKEYVFKQSGLCNLYTPWTGCPPQNVKGSLKALDSDFELIRQDDYHGQIHVAWQFKQGAPASVYPSEPAGWLNIGLAIGNLTYTGKTIPLSRAGGDLTIPIEFEEYDRCEDDYRHPNQTACREHYGINESEPMWLHDVAVLFSVNMGRDYLGTESAFGRSLTVKVDTAGGSFLQLHELMAPPPIEVAAVSPDTPFEDDIYIVEDENGQEEIHFVPAPTLPIFIVAGLAAAALVRRRIG